MKSLLRLMPTGIRTLKKLWLQPSACQNFSKPHGLWLQGFSSYSTQRQNLPNNHSANSLTPLVASSATTVNENSSTPIISPIASQTQPMLTIPSAAVHFKGLIAEDIFVDKTSVIQQIMMIQQACYLFCRPRRWGKSMFLSMLAQYLRIEVNSDGSKKYELSTKDSLAKKRECKPLFYAETNGGKKLKISQNTKMEEKHMGEWPVINLLMPEFGENETLQEMKIKVKSSISNAYQQHIYLVNAWQAQIYKNPDNLRLVQKMDKKIAEFNQIAQNGGRNAEDISIFNSLAKLSLLLKEHFGKEAIILIDQFDRPYYSSFFNSFRKDIYQYLTIIFDNGLKYNSNRKSVVVTSLSRIKGGGGFSSLNIFEEFTVDSTNSAFNEGFGYTTQEVKVFLAKALYGVEKVESSNEETFNAELKLLKDFCNGYWIAGKELYIPWSINQLLKNMQDQKKQGKKYHLKPVYPLTGNMSLIQYLLLNFYQDFDVVELLKTYRYRNMIMPSIPAQHMNTKKSLLHFLYFAGYLTKDRKWKDDDPQTHVYVVPNQEIRIDFYETLVKHWISSKMKTQVRLVQINVMEVFQSLREDKELIRILMGFLKTQLKARENVYGNTNKKLREQVLRDYIMAIIISSNEHLKTKGYEQINYLGSEYLNQEGFKADMTFIPLISSLDTACLHEYKTVKQDEMNVQRVKQAALWQMLSKYFQDIVRISRVSNHIKKVKMSAIVGSGEPKVWIESYTFEMNKAIQLESKLIKFFNEGGNPKAKRKNLCNGKLSVRMQFLKEFNCKDVREALNTFSPQKQENDSSMLLPMLLQQS